MVIEGEVEMKVGSGWRKLFLLNEFNELQTYRYISVEGTLLLVGVFLVGLKWENFSAETPFMTTVIDYVPLNFVLYFFFSSLIYFTIGYVQVLIQRIFIIWWPTKPQDFTDICSLSNVSIFILDEAIHGYYIHGQNPNGTSEVTIEELARVLEEEARGRIRNRGMVLNDQLGTTTFEIFVPWEMRKEYESVYSTYHSHSVTSIKNSQKNGRRYSAIAEKEVESIFKADEYQPKINSAYDDFRSYIENLITEARKTIYEKTAMQRFLRYPPMSSEHFSGKPFFYRDQDYSFQRIFFCGHEIYFLITEIMVFNSWYLLTRNTLSALTLSWIVWRILKSMKELWSEDNISKKAFVNKMFLI